MKQAMWRGALVTLAVVLGVGATACSGGDDAADDGASTATAAATAAATTAAGGGAEPAEGDEIEIIMTDNVFTPANLTIPVNTTVKITIKNEGSAIHNMHILSSETEGKDFASNPLVNPGEDDEFEVTFTKTGVVNFQCDFHLPDMVGTITVQ
ncbi:MAG: cupredoxin domain-containing protein [Dehalococcoidia bacterium]|nr:cupredoxin domain-containing protein [Dehalococcoidia bacterium]